MSERSAEDWGRVAVSLPGWRWMPGMLAINFDGPIRVESVECGEPGVLRMCRFTDGLEHADIRSMPLPDPDDPATAGCLLALLGPGGSVRHDTHRGDDPNTYTAWCDADGRGDGCTPGRAIVALTESIGHWPGGMT